MSQVPSGNQVTSTPRRALVVAALFGGLAGWLLAVSTSALDVVAPSIPWSAPVGLLVVALVVLSRPGRRLLGAARRLPGGVLVTVPAQVLLTLVVVTVARWPFGVWAEVLRRQEGLSVRGWGLFTRDRLVAAWTDTTVTADAG